MRKYLSLIPLFLLLLSCHTHAQVRIVVPHSEASREPYHWLSSYLRGEVVDENDLTDTLLGPTLFVGDTRYARQHLDRLGELSPDGFRLRSDGQLAVLYAPREKALHYGMVRLLELMGYRMTGLLEPTPNGLPVTSWPVVDEVNNPSFAYREIWYHAPYHSQAYADWHGLNKKEDLHWADNMFVHTFQRLIPTSRYFDSHPEWFSEINGRRVRDGQLCLSNPQVLDTLCARLAELMEQDPEATIWSVSNNDNINGCQCPACRHADSIFGGPSGTLVHFVNQVARRFPHKTISTLAYQYTRHAPLPVEGHVERPDSNVNIMFCSIECGREKPLSEDASFAQDIRDWAALTSNIFMWDYVVQFRNFWNPFPNLHVLQPNLKFFHDNGIQWIFEQGTGANNVTSWMELRQYLLAKLLWDVDADADSLTADFCHHYYGAAAPPVLEFLTAIHQALTDSKARLDIYGYPIDAAEGYLAPDKITLYRSLFQEAFRLAGSDHVLRDRVRFLELSVDFAAIELTMAGVLPMTAEFEPLVDRFLQDSRRFEINSLHEMGYSLDQYRAEIDNFLSKSARPNLARDCKVSLKAQPHPHYYALGEEGLTDGRCGVLDYRNRWLGFNPDTLDAIIDLGRCQQVHQVSLDFFFYPLSWIFLPQRIEFYCSKDGLHWDAIETIHPENPEKLAEPLIYTFATKGSRHKARYLRVVAVPLPTIPSWHRATGNTPWIFTDEIIVR